MDILGGMLVDEEAGEKTKMFDAMSGELLFGDENVLDRFERHRRVDQLARRQLLGLFIDLAVNRGR